MVEVQQTLRMWGRQFKSRCWSRHTHNQGSALGLGDTSIDKYLSAVIVKLVRRRWVSQQAAWTASPCTTKNIPVLTTFWKRGHWAKWLHLEQGRAVSLVYGKTFQRAELKGLNAEISEHRETMKRGKKSSPNSEMGRTTQERLRAGSPTLCILSLILDTFSAKGW